MALAPKNGSFISLSRKGGNFTKVSLGKIAKRVNFIINETSWRYLAAGTCAGSMLYAVLAYGGAHTWSYLPLSLFLATLSLGLLASGCYITYKGLSPALVLPRPPFGALVFLGVLFVLIQIMPLPRWLVGLISPGAVQIRALGNGYGLASFFPLSLNPYATMLEFLKLWPAVMIFFILLYSVQSRRQIQLLAEFIVAVAFFEAVYGLWHFRDHMIWGWKNSYDSERLCGTFINSNDLAGYLAMAILLGLGLLQARNWNLSKLSRDLSGWRWLSHWSRPEHLEPLCRRILLIIILLFLTVGLIFTGSRSGMISFLMGLTLTGIISWGQRWQKGYLWLLVILPVIAGAYSLCLGSAPLLGRLLDLSDTQRYHTLLGALAIFREFPVSGSGLATFGDLFYRFEPSAFDGTWFYYAHNEWAQVLAETGILGFTLLCGCWLVFFSRLVKQWQRQQDFLARGLGLGCLAALAAGSFQALAEFPFRVPGFSLTYAAIAALAYLSLHHLPGPSEQFSYPLINLKVPRRLIIGIFSVVMGLQVFLMVQAWQYWQAERIAPTEIDSTRNHPVIGTADLRQALALNPMNSLYYLELAKASQISNEAPKKVEQTEQLLRQAIFRAPANWGYHLKMAEFYQKYWKSNPERNLPRALKELNAATKLFPASGGLHLRLGLFLAWMERYHPGLIAPEMRGRWMIHLEKALKLDSSLKQYLRSKRG
jgi:tetratricopeptide (TPR) repeat protein